MPRRVVCCLTPWPVSAGGCGAPGSCRPGGAGFCFGRAHERSCCCRGNSCVGGAGVGPIIGSDGNSVNTLRQGRCEFSVLTALPFERVCMLFCLWAKVSCESDQRRRRERACGLVVKGYVNAGGKNVDTPWRSSYGVHHRRHCRHPDGPEMATRGGPAVAGASPAHDRYREPLGAGMVHFGRSPWVLGSTAAYADVPVGSSYPQVSAPPQVPSRCSARIECHDHADRRPRTHSGSTRPTRWASWRRTPRCRRTTYLAAGS